MVSVCSPCCAGALQALRTGAVAAAVSRMLYYIGRSFGDHCLADAMQCGIQIDHKRRRQLPEKEMAMGHKADDHENEEIQMK